MVQPIAVGRVGDLRISAFRQGGEFSVASIKIRVNKLLRQIDVFPIFPPWQINAFDSPRRAIDYLLIEAIPNSGLPAGIQIRPILCLDFARHIDQHCSRSKNRL